MIGPIVVAADAFDRLAAYAAERGSAPLTIVADDRTYRAAGERLKARLEAAGLRTAVCLLPPNAQGDVLADEDTIARCINGVREDTRLLAAVGAGTIHDIVRMAAVRLNLDFVAVPTAASVDGFTSSGAPILKGGRKMTVPAAAPLALFADIGVLAAAPPRLAAAGFGDMLAKYTALFDWRFSHLVADEPYDAGLAQEMAAALEDCVKNADGIAAGTAEGIAALMDSLIRSGLVMLRFGASHPASGAEHHLSHYWEMEHLRTGKPQLLHGLKTGFAAVRIAELYHRFRSRMDAAVAAGAGEELLRREAAGGRDGAAVRDGGIGDTAIRDAVSPASVSDPDVRERLLRHWPDIRAAIAAIPGPDRLLSLFRGVYPEIEALPVSAEDIRQGLRHAPAVRPNRYTLLRFLGEHDLLSVPEG